MLRPRSCATLAVLALVVGACGDGGADGTTPTEPTAATSTTEPAASETSTPVGGAFTASLPTLPASLPGSDGSYVLKVDVSDDFEQDQFRFDVLQLSSVRGERVELQTYATDTLPSAVEAVDLIRTQIQEAATNDVAIESTPIDIDGATSAILLTFGATQIDGQDPFQQWSVVMDEPRSGQVWVWRYTGPADAFDEITAQLQLDSLEFVDGR